LALERLCVLSTTLFFKSLMLAFKQDGVKNVFAECGAVQRVILQEKPTSGPPPSCSSAQESLFTPSTQCLVSFYQIWFSLRTQRVSAWSVCYLTLVTWRQVVTRNWMRWNCYTHS